ncbi:hypothetical protein N566_16570, partial [Streptomycetaceae bacterium MP113-05]
RLPGGKGANQAVAVARAGAPVRMAGACGTDEGGGLLLRALERAGVDTAAVRRLPGEDTGTATILVEDSGENLIALTPGANACLGDDDVEAACRGLGAGDVLLMQCEVPLDVVRRAGALAATRGATVVLNVAPVPDAPDLPLSHVDVLLVNEHEARRLAEAAGIVTDPVEACVRALATRYGALVVATLGARGAFATRGEAPRAYPAPRVRATDTVGAGDAFAGYLAAGLSRSTTEGQAIGSAVLAASLAVTRPGAQDAVPHHTELSGLSRVADARTTNQP